MMIGAISGSYNPYSFSTNFGAARQTQNEAGNTVSGQLAGTNRTEAFSNVDGKVTVRAGKAEGTDDAHKVKGGYQSSPADCQTCKERKYKDGSNESDVSFKTPGHINPKSSAATVMAHEQQHVANAYEKAAKEDGKVVSCNVSLHTAVCPECGTVYVSGGTTNTAISYPNESNPYEQNKKAQDAIRFVGANVDYVA